MKRMGLLLVLALAPALVMAQSARLKLPDLSSLASKATESVDIDMDGDTLRTAGAFISGGAGMDPQFAETVKGLQGIYLKVFSFDKPGQYSLRDIEPVLAQVQAQGWKKLLSVRDKEDRVELWLRDNATEGGMFFVASEPKELVLINIVGKVDLETLRRLQGRMGVPTLPGMPPVPPAPPAPPPSPAPAR
jgi:Domain of unknown function (DUF4252)